MRVFLIFVLILFISIIKGQSKLVLQPVLEYKLHTNKTNQYSFYSNNLNWQVLPNNFIESNVINYGVKIGYLSKYLSTYLGLVIDNNRLNNQIKIYENNTPIAIYSFDDTFRYLRITNQFEFFILGIDTVKKNKKIFSQLFMSIGVDLSMPINQELKFNEKNIETLNHKFEVENLYGGPVSKQLFMSIGLTYKIINRKNIPIFNLGINYRITRRNFQGINSNIKVTKTDLNNDVSTYYFYWSASLNGIYVTISKDLVF